MDNNTKTRDDFFLEYKGYAKILAGKFVHEIKDSRIEYDDLYQVGCLALIECYDKYNSSKASYSTFAYITVYYAILNYINYNNGLTYIPINLINLSNYYRKKRQEFYMLNGRNMNISEAIKLISDVKGFKDSKIDEKFIGILDEINRFHLSDSSKSLSDALYSHDAKKACYENDADCMLIADSLHSTSDTEQEAVDRYYIRKAYECISNIPDDDISKKIFIDLMGLNDGIVKTKASLREKYNITSISGIDYHYNKVMKKIQKNIL